MAGVLTKPPYSAAQDPETAIEPDLPICDAHHHLWGPTGLIPYSVEDFARDTTQGHRVETSIYLECDQGYRADGPVELRPVGETELAVGLAIRSRDAGGAEVVGIVPVIDPRLGDAVERVIDAHLDAGQGLVCGFRARVGFDPPRLHANPAHRQWPAQMDRDDFRRGAAVLGRRGIPLDLIFYHSQLGEAAALARAVPGTRYVINHLAFPVQIDGYAGNPDAVFDRWRAGMAALAELPNVAMKIGGFGMSLFGHGWTERAHPATSDEIVATMQRWIDATIDLFGPERCIFESNFPVDGWAFGYVTLWNSLKKMSARLSPDEREQLFRTTALRTYGLPSRSGAAH